jgi:ATP-dependent Zn protease
MALAGRVSEEIFFGEDAVGSGASDDFRKVCLPKTLLI